MLCVMCLVDLYVLLYDVYINLRFIYLKFDQYYRLIYLLVLMSVRSVSEVLKVKNFVLCIF